MMPEKAKLFFERIAELKPEEHKAIAIFDDAPRYEEAEVVALAKMLSIYGECDDAQKRAVMRREFAEMRDSMKVREGAPERIYLWPEGKMPVKTEYTDNSDMKYNHDPDFRPYMLEMLLPEDVTPKGAVVCIPGGDQGFCTVYEGYQVCRDMNAMGYQAFLLHNRVNHNPWSEEESGVDTARALRLIRKNAALYRIAPDNVAVAGFSNGGLTGDNCIRHFSGKQTVADHFPGYEADEMDAFPGSPDAFLCVYGPRFVGSEFDFEKSVYPPTFFAVGRDDFAMNNLNYEYPILAAHGVPVEVHTFAGVPHGMAGHRIIDGEKIYRNFELWYPLADAFMMNAYAEKKN